MDPLRPARRSPAPVLVLVCVVLAGCAGQDGRPGNGAADAAPVVVAPRDDRTIAPASTAVPVPTPVPAPASAWPMAGHDPAHSGSAPVTGPQTGRVRWRRRLEGAAVPGPVLAADGSVLAASNAGVLHALDPATGRDRWTFDGQGSYGIDLSTSPLVLGDDLILWPGPQNTLFALDAEGRERWRVQFGAMVLSPVRGPGRSVYVADMGGELRALEVTTAAVRERWRLRLGPGPSYGSPAVGPDGTIYGTAANDLVAVRDETRSGRVRWRVRTGDLVEVSPAVGPDGTVVIGSNDPYQYGVSREGRVRWRVRRGALTYSSPAVTRAGQALWGDHRGRTTVVDVRTGRVVARYVGLARSARLRAVGVWTMPVTDRDGRVYVGTRPGHVYGFARTGRLLFDVDTGASVESYPALGSDGALYVGSESGEVWAIADR